MFPILIYSNFTILPSLAVLPYFVSYEYVLFPLGLLGNSKSSVILEYDIILSKSLCK